MRKVIVAGFSGSGKSALCVLLDGHPGLRVTYLMEKFTRIFTTGLAGLVAEAGRVSPREAVGVPHFHLVLPGGEAITVKMVTFMRALVGHTYYLALQSEAFAGATTTECCNTDIRSVPLVFDFEKFDHGWKEALFRTPRRLTIEQVIDVLYEQMFAAFPRLPAARPDPALVFCIGEEPDIMDLYLEQGYDAKLVILTRPLEDLWAVEIDRRMATGKTRDACERAVAASGRARRQAELLVYYRRLAEQWPDRVLMLSIDDVVVDYRAVMPRLCAFMGVADHEILYTPTYHGVAEPRLADYVGKVHDAGRFTEITPKTHAILAVQRDDTGVAQAFLRHGVGVGATVARLRLTDCGHAVWNRLHHLKTVARKAM